ncbi:MAG: transglutaminase domain-containing protein [Blastocatellia bacterium]
MRIRIEHTTTFTYDSLISEAYTEMRLAPLDLGGQRRVLFHLQTEPEGEVTRYLDRYDNEVHYFDVLQPHQQFRVTAVSEVLTEDRYRDDTRELSPLASHDYLVATPYTPEDETLQALAGPALFGAAMSGDAAVAAARELMHEVNRAIRYEKGATTVKTTAAEALTIGRGVCQDYAHVMIAAARSAGLPARYVSGYLHSPDAPEMASHAWVDVFVRGVGWFSLDPTHDCAQDARHVRVAVGRDYADVPPTRGVYKGKAEEKMDVVVSVLVVDS